MRAIFLDTSGIFALLVSNDRHHKAAARFVADITKRGGTLITTDYIIDEAVTLLKARKVSHQIPTLFELVAKSAFIKMEWIDPEIFEQAQIFIQRQLNRGYSFTDAVSFIVMKRLKIVNALTADKHFAEAGFSVELRDS